VTPKGGFAMNWEKITSPEFEKGVEECEGVCLLPVGVIEKHGDHLPLGQDAIYIRKICSLAAEQETAMVFPLFYLSQILEAKMVPGTITLGEDLIIPLLERICDEISRNGLNKIIIVNGHGGNTNMLNYFLFTLLDKDKDYMVYLSNGLSSEDKSSISGVLEAEIDGHGGERETSSMLYLYPDMVKMDKYADYGLPLERDKALSDVNLKTGVWWYANQPGHFKADNTPCTKEKGRAFVEAHVNTILKQIEVVKKDDTTVALYREFLSRSQKPAN
jgi:creatinine amidohydrolase